jgi:hypothetical protein
MYYAFQPTTDARTALLSRFPIKGAAAISGASGVTVGMKATIQARQQALTTLLVRPPTTAADQAAIDAVTKEAKSDPKAALVVLASFSPGQRRRTPGCLDEGGAGGCCGLGDQDGASHLSIIEAGQSARLHPRLTGAAGADRQLPCHQGPASGGRQRPSAGGRRAAALSRRPAVCKRV